MSTGADLEVVMNRTSAALGSLVFLLVTPGTVCGLVPFLITDGVGPPIRCRGSTPWLVSRAGRCGGAAPRVRRLRLVRAGTPAPPAPTERLVVEGCLPARAATRCTSRSSRSCSGRSSFRELGAVRLSGPPRVTRRRLRARLRGTHAARGLWPDVRGFRERASLAAAPDSRRAAQRPDDVIAGASGVTNSGGAAAEDLPVSGSCRTAARRRGRRRAAAAAPPAGRRASCR